MLGIFPPTAPMLFEPVMSVLMFVISVSLASTLLTLVMSAATLLTSPIEPATRLTFAIALPTVVTGALVA